MERSGTYPNLELRMPIDMTLISRMAFLEDAIRFLERVKRETSLGLIQTVATLSHHTSMDITA